MATTTKPAKLPKNICLAVDATILTFALTTSKGGTAVVAGNEKISLYDIQGSMYLTNGNPDNNFPVHGSGYVKGNIWNFTLTSVWTSGTNVQTINLRGKLNLITGSGTTSYSNMGPTFSEEMSNYYLYATDCSTFNVPSDTLADEPMVDLGPSTLQ